METAPEIIGALTASVLYDEHNIGVDHAFPDSRLFHSRPVRRTDSGS
jgi:hypothetical protein